MSREFTNGPGDRGSIPGRIIIKMVLDAILLNTQHYKVRINGKVDAVAPSLIPQCCRYRKGKLRVTLDEGGQIYCVYIYVYIFKTI